MAVVWVDDVIGAGAEGGPITATPNASCNPVINEEFSVPPVVVYSPIALLLFFTTKTSDPDTAMPYGKLNPDETRVPVPTGSPAVVYSLISLPFVTKISDPDTVMP